MIVYYRDSTNKLLSTSKQTIKLNSKFKAPKKNISYYTASKSKYSGFTLKSSKIVKLTKKPIYTITYKYAKNVLTPANKKTLKNKVSKFDSALKSTEDSSFYKSSNSNTISVYNNAVTKLDTYVASYLKDMSTPSKISSSFISNETKLLNTCQSTQSDYNNAKSKYDKLHTLSSNDKSILKNKINNIDDTFNSAKKDDFYKNGTDKTIQAYSDAVTKLDKLVAPYLSSQSTSSNIDPNFNTNVQSLIDNAQASQVKYRNAKTSFDSEKPYRDARDGYVMDSANFFDTNFKKIDVTGDYSPIKINANSVVWHNDHAYYLAVLDNQRGYILCSSTIYFANKPDTSQNYSLFTSTLSPIDCGNPTNFEPSSTWFQLDVNAHKSVIWEFDADTNTWKS